MSLFIGCDVGGTNIKAGLVNLNEGDVIFSSMIPSRAEEGHQAVLERIAAHIKQLLVENDQPIEEIQGIGISLPGVLDLEAGKTLFLPNLPGQWRGIPIQDELEKALGLPVTILNDVRAITYGEFCFGAGRGVQRMACYAIGTGVGGGLVVDGNLLLGFQGTAGELGHHTLDMNGPRCGCGNYGCLESFVSGPAIASRAEKAVRQGLTTKIADLVDYDLNKITPEIVAQAAEQGDEVALEIWDMVGSYLGTGIANICVSIGPERVVLAGGVAQAGDLLLKPVKETLQKRVKVMPIEQVEVVLSELGSEAGILGIASWAAKTQR